MCYALSDGRIAALYADKTTVVRSYDSKGKLHTIAFDVSGKSLDDCTSKQISFLTAVENGMRKKLPLAMRLAPPAPTNIVLVNGYLQLPNEELIASLTNGTVQVHFRDQRCLIGERQWCEIPATPDDASSPARWFDRSVEPMPAKLVSSLRRIVLILRKLME